MFPVLEIWEGFLEEGITAQCVGPAGGQGGYSVLTNYEALYNMSNFTYMHMCLFVHTRT